MIDFIFKSMSDKRISQLVERVSIANNDVLPIVALNAATTNKVTISTIQDWMQTHLDHGVTSVGITIGSTGTDISVTGSPVTSTGNITINVPTSSAANRGLLSAADWTTFNNKVGTARSINTTAPLQGGGDLSADRTLSITQAGASSNGYLSSTDWNTFNNKQDALGYTPVNQTRQLTINGTSYDLSADRTWNVGTVTSIGVSMPSAFTVSNSPITSSGTIAITGAGSASQYIDGTGALQTFPTIIGEASNLVREVYNESGATMTKGTVVYINGGHGNLPTIAKALATGDSTSAQTYGVVQNNIGNNSNGFIVVIGDLIDMVTDAYTEGTQLYLSGTTAGAFTSTKPYAPIHLVYVGIVTRSHPTQGVIAIKIQNGYEMDELHNVDAHLPSNGDILKYVSSTGLWTKTAGTTTNIPEGTNLYYTDARSRSAFSETVTGLDYNSSTGVLSTSTGYGIPTTASQTNWDAAYNDKINSAEVTGTTTKTLTLTQQDGGTITASWTDINTDAVTSVFGRTGAIVAVSGDYNTDLVTEGSTNLYFTDARARAAISLTTTGSSGAATYSAGVLNVPNYTLAGLGGEPSITAGTTAQYWRGDKTWQTLNTANVPELTNLYFTNARSRSSISLTTTGTSGAATYDSATGVLNIPQYQGGVTSFNTRTGAITLTGGDVRDAIRTGVGATPIDANTFGYGFADNYYGTSQIQNAPIGGYGTLYNFGGANNTALALQMYSTINHDSATPTKDLYFRMGNNLGFGLDWRKVWDSVNLTNLNQLTNGPGYITASANITGSSGSTTVLASHGDTGITVQAGSGTIIHNYAILTNVTGLFPSVDNSNDIITINRHPDNYYSQLGFSSNGNMYYRSFNNEAINTTKAWRTVWDSGSLTNLNQLTNGPGFVTSTDYVRGLLTIGLGDGSMNVNNPSSAVYRNENGLGGNLSYAPVLHLGGGDTMWQITGDYYNSSTLRWRAGYNGTWYAWRDIYHTGNLTNLNQLTNGPGYITAETDTLATVVARGATTTATVYLNSGNEFLRNRPSTESAPQYQTWYNSAGTRRGYFGYGSYNSNTLELNNESGGQVLINGGDVIANGTYFRMKGEASAEFIWYKQYSGTPSQPGFVINNRDGNTTFSHNANGGGTSVSGGFTAANLTSSNSLYLPGAGRIIVNGETDVWGARLRTTDGTTNLGAGLKHILFCGGGTNEGFAVSGSGMGASFEVKNNGVAWIKTELNVPYVNGECAVAGSQIGRHRGSFTVGGNASTFYPVAFQIGSGSTFRQGLSVLQIERGGYDDPGFTGIGFSTFHCRIRAKADGWGFGASYWRLEGHAYTMPCLADITQQNQTSQLIVWLRGATVYNWHDVEGSWSLNFDNSAGGNYTTFSGNVTYTPTTTNTIGAYYSYEPQWGQVYFGGLIQAGGDVVAFSDARVKGNIRPIENVLDRVCNSRGVLYDRTDNESKDNIGFIAQELEESFPELVVTDEAGKKSVKYQNATAILFEAIKEQQKQIDELKKLIK